MLSCCLLVVWQQRSNQARIPNQILEQSTNTHLQFEVCGMRGGCGWRVSEKEDSEEQGHHADHQLHGHEGGHAGDLRAVVVAACSAQVSRDQHALSNLLGWVDFWVTSRAGMICPKALPMGLKSAPAVVEMSLSFTGNHVEAIAAGRFTYIG